MYMLFPVSYVLELVFLHVYHTLNFLKRDKISL